MEEDFQSWKDEMWHSVCEHFGLAVSSAELGRFGVYVLLSSH
jgi:hypothetical protein